VLDEVAVDQLKANLHIILFVSDEDL